MRRLRLGGDGLRFRSWGGRGFQEARRSQKTRRHWSIPDCVIHARRCDRARAGTLAYAAMMFLHPVLFAGP
jgi:hypothetical protein